MKKLYLPMAVALVGTLTAAAGAPVEAAAESDVITAAVLNKALGAGNELEVRDPYNWEQLGKDGSFVAEESGTSYVFANFFCNAENPSDLETDYMSYLYNQDAPAGYIKAVTGVTSAYFSTSPMNSYNYYAADYAYSESPEIPIVPNGAASYVYIPGFNSATSYIAIEWGDEPNVGKAPVPYVSTNFDDCRPGTIVYMNADGAEIHLHAVSSTGADVTETGEGSLQFSLEGEAGTTWTLDIYTSKAGCEDSETYTYTYTINVPTLSEPYISYPSLDDGEHMPVNGIVTIANYNFNEFYETVGTICYEINHSGEILKGEGAEISFRAEGEIGQGYEVEAWIEAEGFISSEKVYMGTILNSNVLPAPTFSPDGGSVLPGSEISISAPEYVEYITYRINDGEWNTVYNWDVTVKITEDCTVYAYSDAGNPDEASFANSETVSADFVLEKLSENEVMIDAEALSLDNTRFDLSSYYYETPAYGKFEYYGWTMSTAMSFDDAYEDAVGENEWLRNIESNENITAIKANMVRGALAVYFADEVIEETAALYNNNANDYAVIGSEIEGKVSAANGQWLELDGTEFEGHKYFFARGYESSQTTSSSAFSVLIRFGKTNSVQTVEDVTESDARYYTLDGLAADGKNLKPGLYIRVLGSKAEKVLVK